MAALLWLFTAPALAEWSLDPDRSSVNFISTKNGAVAELHSFDRIAGSVSDAGEARLQIDLTSVNTRIGIRDERMRELLFETGRFPTATIGAVVETDGLDEVGVTRTRELALEIDLHGHTGTARASLDVTRLDANTLLVSTRSPLILSAGDFELGAGLERLREVAGLNAISPAVPVTASLLFRR
jgi:polyisoprenoid-binding protein YceI